MTYEITPQIKHANKNQIKIAFNDISYRLSPYQIKRLTIYDFIDMCNKKYKLHFNQNLVQEVFDEIYKIKNKILANYDITKKCLTNLIVKFSIFVPDSYTFQDLINELNKNQKYSFDNIIIEQIINEYKII
jgi:hypothetical protein